MEIKTLGFTFTGDSAYKFVRFCNTKEENLLRDLEIHTVDIAQKVRAIDCDSMCREFDSHYPPYL